MLISNMCIGETIWWERMPTPEFECHRILSFPAGCNLRKGRGLTKAAEKPFVPSLLKPVLQFLSVTQRMANTDIVTGNKDWWDKKSWVWQCNIEVGKKDTMWKYRMSLQEMQTMHFAISTIKQLKMNFQLSSSNSFGETSNNKLCARNQALKQSRAT